MKKNIDLHVTGTLLLFPEVYPQIEPYGNIFSDPLARDIYAEIERAKGVYDIHLICERIGTSQSNYTAADVMQTIDDVVTETMFPVHLKEIVEKNNKRRIQAVREIISSGDMSSSAMIDGINSVTASLTQHDGDTFVSAEQFCTDFASGNYRRDMIDSGIGYLGEIESGSLVIVAARPSVGKTTYMKNIAITTSKNAHCAVFSAEMAHDHIFQHILGNLAGLNANHLLDVNTQTAHEKGRLMKALETLAASPIHIDDTPNIDVDELRRRARLITQKRGTRYIFVDYLQLLQTAKYNVRRDQVGYISRTLKQIARENRCIVYAMAQLNREVEKRVDGIPVMADLRDSGEIEQDADVIIMLHRADSCGVGEEYIDCYVRKFRNGATGSYRCHFDKIVNRFRELNNYNKEN